MANNDLGSGFAVDPASLSGAAGKLGTAYDDFDTAITAYQGTSCDVKTAYGDVVGDAWQAFDTTWLGEMTETKRAIADTVRRTYTTADMHRENETWVTQAIQAAVRP